MGRMMTAARALPMAFLLGTMMTGCGTAPSKGPSSEPGARTEGAQEPARPANGRFEEPGELDRMLDAKPLPQASVKAPAASAAPAAAAPAAAPGKGKFRIQVGAETDFDAAQAKKKEYERLLGGTVDMSFDAPYYKLRWGSFETKQEAEDKILEISDSKIQAFVVKQ